MNTQTAITLPIFCQLIDSKLYEVIENEIISSLNFIGLTISGSLLSQTTFREVTFESCAFYGTYIEHCEFIGCTFKNCTFEFSKIHDCNFNATTIENCTWESSAIKTSLFRNSYINLDTAVNITYYGSLIEKCFIPAIENEIIENRVADSYEEKQLPPIPTMQPVEIILQKEIIPVK